MSTRASWATVGHIASPGLAGEPRFRPADAVEPRLEVHEWRRRVDCRQAMPMTSEQAEIACKRMLGLNGPTARAGAISQEAEDGGLNSDAGANCGIVDSSMDERDREEGDRSLAASREQDGGRETRSRLRRRTSIIRVGQTEVPRVCRGCLRRAVREAHQRSREASDAQWGS